MGDSTQPGGSSEADVQSINEAMEALREVERLLDSIEDNPAVDGYAAADSLGEVRVFLSRAFNDLREAREEVREYDGDGRFCLICHAGQFVPKDGCPACGRGE